MTADAVLAGPRVRKDNGPIYLIAFGHGTTHWITAAFYVLVPLIQDELGLSYAEVGLFVTIFYISSTVTNLCSGFVVDATGRRVLVQIVSLVAGAAALALCGLAGVALVVYAMLALLGAANNLWHPAAISYLSGRYADRRGYALAMHALGANLGDMVAPFVTGALVVLLTWQQTAAVAGLLPLLAAVLIGVRLLRTDAPANGGSAAAAMTFRAYLAGVCGMFRSRAILALCLMAGFRSVGQNGLLLFLPLYLANVLGASPFWTGATLSALQMGGVVAAPLAGIWSDRVGRRPVVMAGLTVTTVLLAGLTFVDDATIYIALVAVMGFALFAVRPVIQSWMMDLAPPHLAGSATSALFGVQALLSSLAPLVGGALADAFGLLAAFYFLAATMLLANALAFLLPRGGAVAQAA